MRCLTLVLALAALLRTVKQAIHDHGSKVLAIDDDLRSAYAELGLPDAPIPEWARQDPRPPAASRDPERVLERLMRARPVAIEGDRKASNDQSAHLSPASRSSASP